LLFSTFTQHTNRTNTSDIVHIAFTSKQAQAKYIIRLHLLQIGLSEDELLQYLWDQEHEGISAH